MSESEFKHAEMPNERDRASYLKENWKSLQTSGQLELKPDDYEVVEGLTMRQMRGHNATMQTACLRRGARNFVLLCRLCSNAPSSAVGLGEWDLIFIRLETLANKKLLLPLAVEENWHCLFYHDFERPIYRLTEKEGKFSVKEFPLN